MDIDRNSMAHERSQQHMLPVAGVAPESDNSPLDMVSPLQINRGSIDSWIKILFGICS